MATTIQLRRGTASQWTTAAPVLAAGELGIETDTGKVKVGNGTSAWASLAYLSGSGITDLVQDTTPQLGGNLDAQGNRINNLSAPSSTGDAATLGWVNTQIGSLAPTSRTITAGTGLTGGGDLTANRTLAVSYGTTAGTATQGNDSRLADTRTPTDGSVTDAKMSTAITKIPEVLVWTGSAWPARSSATRPVTWRGGVYPTNAPTMLAIDSWEPASGSPAAGDASTNTSSSVDSEVVLFSGTTGKTLKRATSSGLAKLTSGVLGTATAGTDYVTPTGTETVSGKTLTNPTINNYTEGVVAIGNTGTAQTIALTSGTVQTATLTGNCTFTMPTATAGKSFTLLLRSGAGSFTATFTGVKWTGGTAPTITATASRLDIFTFFADGTNWYGSYAQNYTP